MDQSYKGEQGRKMRLFDTSAIIVLCRENKIDKLLEGGTINSAFYEPGNAVWKHHHPKENKRGQTRQSTSSLTEVFRRLKKTKTEDALEI